VFQRSAKQAGLFELASDRLSTPPGLNAAARDKPPIQTESTQTHFNGGGASVGGGAGSHPFIQGLLAKLPKPESEWAIEARAKWLTTAANIFDLMYAAPQGAESKTIAVQVQG
jgi:hypothetical protein